MPIVQMINKLEYVHEYKQFDYYFLPPIIHFLAIPT